MRLFAILAALLLAIAPVQAQDAKALLDKASAQLLKSGGMQANFTATTFKGTKESGTVSGTLQVQGSKFKVTSSSMTTWFDGKTQWSLLAGSDEVNVSTPTSAEIQKMNPYNFITLYKKGYTASAKKVSYRGKTCDEITLRGGTNAEIARMVIILDSANRPVNVRIRDRKGNWMRFRINSLQTGKKFPDSTFRFDKNKYPGIEIIDLR